MGAERAPYAPSEFHSAAPADTEAHAGAFARTLAPGDVVLVRGEIGAGKTTWVRGACRALGVEEPVRSPTFTLARRYRGRAAISHLDLYRLESLLEEEPGLLDDYLDPEAICFVEWPERAEGALSDRVDARIRISHLGGDRRLIEVLR